MTCGNGLDRGGLRSGCADNLSFILSKAARNVIAEGFFITGALGSGNCICSFDLMFDSAAIVVLISCALRVAP